MLGSICSARTLKICAVVVTVLVVVQYVLSALVFSKTSFPWRLKANETLSASLIRHVGMLNASSVNRTHAINETGIFNVTGAVPDGTPKPTNTTLPLCPVVPPNLVGRIKVFTENPPTLEELAKQHPELEPGGRWRPKDCIARHRMAIVIPYRNREEHLRVFLHNVHPLMQKQQLDYSIIISELAMPTQFNRAMLMNVGYAEGIKLYPYQCFIFSDVDLIPEDDRNIYSCPKQPRHMSVAVSKFKYKLPYASIFGGVTALTVEQLRKVNGYSNKFFGWGGEDDDMYNRVKHHGYSVSRYPIDIARYTMISHKGDTGNKANPQRFDLLRRGKTRFSTDGISSLIYKVLKVELKPLYTWVYVEINEQEVMKS